MKKTVVLALLVPAMLTLLLWAPWVTNAMAEARLRSSFEDAWRDVADGCGFHCQGCGILATHRVLAGVQVSFEYACGMLPYDSPEFHETGVAFVSFLGTASGFPRP